MPVGIKTKYKETLMDALESKIRQLDMSRMPRHVAIIMDGNGRWALQRGKERSLGHVDGVPSVRNVTELSSDLGIKYLTLYTFSTENWNRPAEEVEALMYLIGTSIERETPDLVRNNVHLNLIGDIESLPADALARLRACADATAHCDGLVLTLALSYSGRSELTRAARLLARQVADGILSPGDITDASVAGMLYTAGMPDPDLLIRTGGECRVSNYLLWQTAYSELYFTPTLWPDFDKNALADALLDYQGRERRFGLTGAQVKGDIFSQDDPLAR